jgi:hypothetical protein
MPMNVEEEYGKDLWEIEEFRRCEGNATDAGKFDPSLDEGIAPHRHEGGGGQRISVIPKPRGESISQMVAERRQYKGCQSYPERLRGDPESIRGPVSGDIDYHD